MHLPALWRTFSSVNELGSLKGQANRLLEDADLGERDTEPARVANVVLLSERTNPRNASAKSLSRGDGPLGNQLLAVEHREETAVAVQRLEPPAPPRDSTELRHEHGFQLIACDWVIAH